MATARGPGREALAALREQLHGALSGVDAGAVSQDLFSLLRVLDTEHLVRRSLADSAIDGDRKAGLLRDLTSGRISDTAADIADGLVRARWPGPATMLESLEFLAIEAEVTAAHDAGHAEDFEDELFRFGRIVAGDAELRSALSDRALPTERKRQLVEALLDSKVTPSAFRLAVEAVVSPRARSLEENLGYYVQVAAEHDRRLVAYVRSAVELTDSERDRLSGALRRMYGQDVRLNAEVDPSVVGGLSVVVGADLIEGTIARRIDEARRKLAG